MGTPEHPILSIDGVSGNPGAVHHHTCGKTRSHAPTPLTGRFYGEDVNLELPYTERDNPYFVGCLDRGA